MQEARNPATQLNSELMIKAAHQIDEIARLQQTIATHVEATARAELELLISQLSNEEAVQSDLCLSKENAQLRLENAELSARAERAEEQRLAAEEQKGQLCKLVEQLQTIDSASTRKPKVQVHDMAREMKELLAKIKVFEEEKEQWHALWLSQNKPKTPGRSRALGEVTNISLFTPTAKPGLRYEIPHKFEAFHQHGKGKAEIKCAACPLVLSGRHDAVQCSDCGCTVHSRCANAMPRTCGASEELLKQFKSSPKNIQTMCSEEEEIAPLPAVVKVYNAKAGAWIDEVLEVIDGLLTFDDSAKPQFDPASPTVSAEANPTACPTALATSDHPCYVQLLSADPCWPKVAVHVLFQNRTTLRQWLDWVKFQKNRAWSGAAVDKGAVPDGVKRVVARLETGQLGPINSAAVVQQSNDSSEKAIIATDLGLYLCEEGYSAPRRVRTELVKVTSVAAVSPESVLCIAGDTQSIYEVQMGGGCQSNVTGLPGGGGFVRLAVSAPSTTTPGARTAIGVTPDMIAVFAFEEGTGWTLGRTIPQRSNHVGSVAYLPLSSGGVFAIVSDFLYIVDAAVDSTTRPVAIPTSDPAGRQSSWVFPMQAFAIGDEILLCNNICGTFVTRGGSRCHTPVIKWPSLPLGFSQLSSRQIAVSGWDSIITYAQVGTPESQATRVHAGPNVHLLGDCVWATTEKTGTRVFVTRPLPERYASLGVTSDATADGEQPCGSSMFGRGLPPFSVDLPVSTIADDHALPAPTIA